MTETTRILINIGSTEPTSWTELLSALGDHAPERGQNHEWSIFFKQLESLEELKLVEIKRSGGRVESLILTPLGAERAREALRGR